MIRRFNDIEPTPDAAYDVFNSNGDYIGYCNYYDGKWYDDENDITYTKVKGTYYSDDHNDWLRMVEGLIKVQDQFCAPKRKLF